MTTNEIVAVVSGGVGMVTGIAGFVLGWKGYRRADELKAMDLRMQLANRVIEVRAGVEQCERLIVRAVDSRVELLGATGLARSGASKRLEIESRDRRAILAGVKARLRPDEDYHRESPEKLEPLMAEVHVAATSIVNLKTEIEAAIDKDSRDLQHLSATKQR